MSKLIIEIEMTDMPKNCSECQLKIDEQTCFNGRGVFGIEVQRMSWCPIKGVLPDEHGDLIDRDALKKQCWNDDGFDLWVSHTEIDQQPTVIAAERKDDETTVD